MDHHLACYLGMKAISQSQSMKELVLGCCVPGSSLILMPPLWETRRPWGQGCSACVVFYHVIRWRCWLTGLWKIFSPVLAWKKSIVNNGGKCFCFCLPAWKPAMQYSRLAFLKYFTNLHLFPTFNENGNFSSWLCLFFTFFVCKHRWSVVFNFLITGFSLIFWLFAPNSWYLELLITLTFSDLLESLSHWESIIIVLYLMRGLRKQQSLRLMWTYIEQYAYITIA